MIRKENKLLVGFFADINSIKPCGSIVSPFKIKKASLALQAESRLETNSVSATWVPV